MTTLTFTVIGEPVTKGSTTSWAARKGDGSIVIKNGKPVIITQDATGERGRSSEASLAYAAMEARGKAGFGAVMREAAVAVTIRFYRPRNKGHYGTGRNANTLKDSAPMYPATAPDLDKYVRRVLDAMTGVIYRDDGQVVSITCTKEYGDPARTEVEVDVLAKQMVGPTVPEEQLALAA